MIQLSFSFLWNLKDLMNWQHTGCDPLPGDIEMHGVTADNKPVDCAARFTHGTLEWIRPLDELDELHRVSLTEKA